MNYQNSGLFSDDVSIQAKPVRDNHLISILLHNSQQILLRLYMLLCFQMVLHHLGFGLKSFKPACEPGLTAFMKSKHLTFAVQHEKLDSWRMEQSCFQMNLLCNSLLCIKEIWEDSLVSDLMNRIQIRVLGIHQARWFGMTRLYIEQQKSTYFQE